MTDEEKKLLDEQQLAAARSAKIERPAEPKPNTLKKGFNVGMLYTPPTVADNAPAADAAVPNAVRSYEDMINRLEDEEKARYEAERAKAKRNSRTAGIISGIADMAGALGNIYFANKGVPVAFNPTDGLTKRAQDRYDKALAEMNSDHSRRLNYIERMGKRFKDKEAVDYKNELLKLKREENERKAKKDEANEYIQRAKIDIATGNMELRRFELELRELYQKGIIDLKEMNYHLSQAKEANRAAAERQKNAPTVTEETKTDEYGDTTTTKRVQYKATPKPNGTTPYYKSTNGKKTDWDKVNLK